MRTNALLMFDDMTISLIDSAAMQSTGRRRCATMTLILSAVKAASLIAALPYNDPKTSLNSDGLGGFSRDPNNTMLRTSSLAVRLVTHA